MRVRHIFIFTGLLFMAAFAQAQEQGGGYSYSKEFIWGVNKNTSGGLIGGIVFKKSLALSDRVFQTFGLEVMNVKHPMEVRYASNRTGNFFIWGKENYLYTFRFQYGRDIILFRKAPEQGVQIAAMFAAGPSLGLVAPYYVERQSSGSSRIPRTERVPFNEDISFSDIWGTGRVFQGVQDSEIAMGLNLKMGISFEFGAFKSNVTGFEAGFLLDAYSREIPLVVGAQNKQIFPTGFITIFYGSRR